MTDTYRLRHADTGRTAHRPRPCVDCGRPLAREAGAVQCPRCQRRTLSLLARSVDRAAVGADGRE